METTGHFHDLVILLSPKEEAVGSVQTVGEIIHLYSWQN